METVYCDECKAFRQVQAVIREKPSNKCPHCGGGNQTSHFALWEQIDKDVYDASLRMVEKVPLLIVAGTRLKVTAPMDIINHFKQKNRRFDGIYREYTS